MEDVKDNRRAALRAWENEGGATPSDRQALTETEREKSAGRAVAQAALDASYDSSARGEHRYPASHQTTSEQQARRERDAFKRRIRGTR